MTLHVSLGEIRSYLCVGQHVPGVEAEAAPGFTSSAGLMITGWLSSSVSSLGNNTNTHTGMEHDLFTHRAACRHKLKPQRFY